MWYVLPNLTVPVISSTPSVEHPIFTVLPDGKKLRAVTAMEVNCIYHAKEMSASVEYIVTLADRKDPVAINTKHPAFYRSEKDFHNGVMIGENGVDLYEQFRNCTRCNWTRSQDNIKNGTFQIELFYYNGEMPIEIIPNEVCVRTDSKGCKHMAVDGVSLTNDNTYKSIASCLAVNPHKVVLPDGTEVMRDALDRPFMLTDEQNAMIDELEALLERMKQANICVYFDSDARDVYAYNKTNCTHPIYDDSPEYLNDDNPDNHIVNDKVGKHERRIHSIYYKGCDDSIYETPEYVQSQTENK